MGRVRNGRGVLFIACLICLGLVTFVMFQFALSHRVHTLLKLTKKDLELVEEFPHARTTAIAFKTLSPIHPRSLQKIHSWAKELQDANSAYNFVVLVDETEKNGTAQSLWQFFDAVGSTDLPLPRIFPVSDEIILREYPKLESYVYNKPEKNVNDEPGLCCERRLMWQMGLAALSLLMHQENSFTHAWFIGDDDLDVVGEHTLTQLIRKWDMAMHGKNVDLAAQSTTYNGIPFNEFIVGLHTVGFHKIIEMMGGKNSSSPPWTSMKPLIPRWTCVSGSLQRHSRAFSDRLYYQISQNIYQFAECMAQPIAWEANLTIQEISEILDEKESGVSGLESLLPKKSRIDALNQFMRNKKLNMTTLIFHEEYEAIR